MKKGINNKGFKALPSSVQNNILSNMKYGGYGKKYAAGGAMPMEQLTEFNEGGRHEENGLGGIPQGMNPEGQMNLVEEGETKFDAENYIYSDSLKVDKELAEAFNLSPKMVGKTFADASKMAGRKKSKREGDAIEMAANEKDLMNLMEAQEAFKQKRIEEKLQEIAELDPNALPALMGQGQPQGGPQGDPAMGGQMQGAPMDEQAMMEQQMMAEQQAGGGQPSPEEMAMMQQQQDMAMGQQEGMMRNGGFTDPLNGGSLDKILGDENMNSDLINKYSNERIKSPTAAPQPLNPNKPMPFPGYDQDGNKLLVPRKTGGYMSRSMTLGGFGDPPSKLGNSNMYYNPAKPILESVNFNTGTGAGSNIGMNEGFGVTGGITDELTDMGPAYLESLQGTTNPAPNPSGFTGMFNNIKNKMGGNLMQSGQEAGLNPMQGMNQFFNMGGILGGGLAQQNLNLNQGLASQMRRGGKMCYGCGGAMHNFGGRMSNMNQMATGGEIVAGIGSGLYGLGEGLLDTLTFGLTDDLTDKGYEKLKSIGPDADGNAGDMIRGGANAAGAVGGAILTGGATTGAAISEGSEGIGETLGAVGKQTGNDTYTKVGQGISGAGQIAGLLVGDASGAAGAAGTAAGAGAGTLSAGAKAADAADAASKASRAAKFAKVGEIAQNDAVQLGLNMGTQAIDASTQNAAQTEAEEYAAEQARLERERETLQGNKGFATGGYMGTRSYGKGGRPGLWANMHNKRARGEAPLQPGDPNYPTDKAIKASQNDMGGRLYNTGGPLTLKKSITNPDGTTIQQDVTYNSLEELLADTDMVNKYGGKEATKQAFAERFKKNSNIPTSLINPIETIKNEVLNPALEENPAMVSYINKFKEQEELDRQNAVNIMPENPDYMPQVKRLPILPPDLLTMPESNQEIIIPSTDVNSIPNEVTTPVETSKTEIIPKGGVVNPNKDDDDNEVDVDVDQKDINRDFTFKETPGQFAAKMAAPMMNLYSGLFDKYDPRFEPEFQEIETPKLDYSESVNSIRRNAAKIKRSFNKVGSNPGNLLAVSQQTNSLEAQTIQQIDVINAKLEFEGEKLNNAQKQKLEKIKKELQLGFEEAKRKSLQAAAEQFQQIATTNQANELALKYAAMGAEDIAEPDYKTLVQQLGDLLKKRKENKKLKKNK